MARRIEYLSSRIFAIAALLALAAVVFCGSANAHGIAPDNHIGVRDITYAVDINHCPGNADCEPESGNSSLPCSGMSNGHCSQAGVSAVPASFAMLAVLAGRTPRRAEDFSAGIFSSVDTPPPRG